MTYGDAMSDVIGHLSRTVAQVTADPLSGSSEGLSGGHGGRPPAALPNAQRAVADPRKFWEYALNPQHPQGRHKARVFASARGYDRDNRAGLREQLLQGVQRVAAAPGLVDEHGARFTVDIPVTGPNGATAVVRTVWIYPVGSDVPELVTLLIA